MTLDSFRQVKKKTVTTKFHSFETAVEAMNLTSRGHGTTKFPLDLINVPGTLDDQVYTRYN
jgi:hypothetical protein